jgi:hypothetical protein
MHGDRHALGELPSPREVRCSSYAPPGLGAAAPRRARP